MTPKQSLERHLLINPYAGNGKGKSFAGLLSSSPVVKGLPVVVPSTLEYSQKIANELNRDRVHLLVAGGDGTFNTILNQVYPPYRFTVSFLPCGSGNDLIRFLGISRNPIDALHASLNGSSEMLLDLWEAKIGWEDGSVTRQKFINTAGIGFDAYVGTLKQQKRFLTGLAVYTVSLLQALIKYDPINFELESNGNETISGEAMFITSGNGASSGGGFKLTPKAQINDGLVDVCIVSYLSRFKVLRIFPKAITGTHIGIKEVKYLQTDRYKIKLSKPSYIHLDGETTGKKVSEVELYLSPHKLKILL
ncbi:MAG: hypothetical protein LC102_04210 [Ignavibacteriales bacterium]|nr:MAG: hypothetical protein F9K26_02645 [Ignavibacteriaceae bacterium]MBW7872332.1 hypothetical protein [Ignavibacteria bacterium]MCZ2142615.1 hypothetical protein [Ignavibacteriales bacterium]OQY74579.1 MAG: hypothetical protein B6D45_06740 [Ignavibacteriales bacterium UTCHB3]MBV6445521.1 Diacylglycerol kinase [Ignavibacteriaceae bacterium]